MSAKKLVTEPDLRWDRRWMAIAAHVGQEWGCDDGCCVVDANNGLVSIGYYALPRGMRESPERASNETFMLEHGVTAVERALLTGPMILHAAAPLTLYYTPRMLGLGDARLVMQVGIRRVVVQPTVMQADLDAGKAVRALFRECGVRLDIVSSTDVPGDADEDAE